VAEHTIARFGAAVVVPTIPVIEFISDDYWRLGTRLLFSLMSGPGDGFDRIGSSVSSRCTPAQKVVVLKQRFAEKVVVISGAGSGMGAAAARRFALDGGIVVLIGRRKEKLDSVAKTLDASRTWSAPCDVAKAEDVERVTQEVLARFGRIDVLVNSAGVGYLGGFLDLPLRLWNEMLAVNLNGVAYFTRSTLPSLMETRGAIVNVASIAASGGEKGNSMYAAGKAAVNVLTKSLALEFGHLVRVNCVNPGLTRSELTEVCSIQSRRIFR
jgi:meso-butanediol dehydrogenase / (S,S)-butanediol dehydrogenase / diacetyl reductase